MANKKQDLFEVALALASSAILLNILVILKVSSIFF